MIGRRLACAALVSAAPFPLAAQSIVGRVLDSSTEATVAGASVTMVAADGSTTMTVLTDSLGRFALTARSPGDYGLRVDQLGYRLTSSPLFALTRVEPPYRMDVELTPEPLEIQGLMIEADQRATRSRRIRQHIGINPVALHVRPIDRTDLESHAARAHTITDIVRWNAPAAIVVRQTNEGPCYRWRNYFCIDVYLDGVRVLPEFVESLPTEVMESVVIIEPKESVVYEAGAILVFTAGWFRGGR